jgi:hypothetical protein
MVSRLLWILGSLSLLACSAGGGPVDGAPGGPSGSGAGAASSGDDTFFTDGDETASNPSGIGDGDRCGSHTLDTSVESVVEPGNVLIIFDQSASMDSDFEGVPLWRAAADAVAQALTPLQDQLTIGAIFFPTSGADWTCVSFVLPCGQNCVAPMSDPEQFAFQPGRQFLQAWEARWQTAGLVTGTPLDSATVQADVALSQATLTGATVVIIVTDGEPTCSLTPGSVALAQGWHAAGIRTFVVGLPGFLGSGVLTDIAVAGGTDRFLTPTDADAVRQEIQNITGTVVRQTLNDCSIVFNELPDDVQQIALVVTDSQTGSQYRVEQGSDGWELAADGTRGELKGLTCTEALEGRFSTISFEFGCTTVPILR